VLHKCADYLTVLEDYTNVLLIITGTYVVVRV